jgi:2-dehydro-3-deoxygalactonokinase
VVSFGSRFLAVDWGTTNRRVFLIDGGAVARPSVTSGA